MNPCDFAFFGVIERKVFVPPQPTTVQQLKARITAVIVGLNRPYIRKSCDAVHRRA